MKLEWQKYIDSYSPYDNLVVKRTIRLFRMTIAICLKIDGKGYIWKRLSHWTEPGFASLKESTRSFKTISEAMVDFHAALDKVLWKTVKVNSTVFHADAVIGYCGEELHGYKKALTLFETDDTHIKFADFCIVECTIPKGALVCMTRPAYGPDGMASPLFQDLKCRADRAIISDTLICRPGDYRPNVHNVPGAKIYPIHTCTIAWTESYGRRTSLLMMEILIRESLGFRFPSTIPNYSLEIRKAIDELHRRAEKIAHKYGPLPTGLVHKMVQAQILEENIPELEKTAYSLGDIIEIDNFNVSVEQCGPGFHFFETYEGAKRYDWR